MILVDAGPLIALLHRGDRHHESCVRVFRELAEPMSTVWPAFTEAMHLLRSSRRAQDALWELVEQNAIELLTLDERDFSRMRALMEKYSDLPMDLADAGLVRAAERDRIRRVFTLDRRDFAVYRPRGLGRFDLLPIP